MNILKDVTEGIEPSPFLSYQRVLWDRMNQGGLKKGQMTLYSAVQHTGKSLYQKMVLSNLYGTNLCKEIMLPVKPAPKYKFSRAKWYTAEYDWIHQGEVYEWCTQQFGPHPMYPDAWSRWYNKYNEKIHFRDAKDYEWFLLRWS